MGAKKSPPLLVGFTALLTSITVYFTAATARLPDPPMVGSPVVREAIAEEPAVRELLKRQDAIGLEYRLRGQYVETKSHLIKHLVDQGTLNAPTGFGEVKIALQGDLKTEAEIMQHYRAYCNLDLKADIEAAVKKMRAELEQQQEMIVE